MNTLNEIEKEQIKEILKKRAVPEFKSGDTVRVNVFVTEGNKERIQAFEGVCIARSNRGFNSTFTIRKISHGEGVERVFPIYSPMLESITLIRRGKVRRSKLYYLRQRSGKSARIAEKKDKYQKKEVKKNEQPKVQDNKNLNEEDKKATDLKVQDNKEVKKESK